MLKKTIKYVDFNGEEREEDFYFHLSRAELMEMELLEVGGLTSSIERIVAEKNIPRIIEIFKTLILTSYGEKSPDGKRFIKNQELKDSFEQTEAYSVLFMSLASDADKAVEFVNGIIPSI